MNALKCLLKTHIDSSSSYFDFVCEADRYKSKQKNGVSQNFKSLARMFFKSATEKNLKVYLTCQGSIDRHMVNISSL